MTAPAPLCACGQPSIRQWTHGPEDCRDGTLIVASTPPVTEGASVERGCGPGCYEPGMVAALRERLREADAAYVKLSEDFEEQLRARRAAEAEVERHAQKDRQKTAEINILVPECRAEKARADALAVEVEIQKASVGIVTRQLDSAEVANERLRDLLRRISGWDHMDTAGDGNYWREEIRKALEGSAR